MTGVGTEVVCAYYPNIDQAYITPWSEETGQLLAEAARPDGLDVIYYLDVI